LSKIGITIMWHWFSVVMAAVLVSGLGYVALPVPAEAAAAASAIQVGEAKDAPTIALQADGRYQNRSGSGRRRMR
jgi:hypothetical protein